MRPKTAPAVETDPPLERSRPPGGRASPTADERTSRELVPQRSRERRSDGTGGGYPFGPDGSVRIFRSSRVIRPRGFHSVRVSLRVPRFTYGPRGVEREEGRD